jgi:hypothetical protein
MRLKKGVVEEDFVFEDGNVAPVAGEEAVVVESAH